MVSILKRPLNAMCMEWPGRPSQVLGGTGSDTLRYGPFGTSWIFTLQDSMAIVQVHKNA